MAYEGGEEGVEIAEGLGAGGLALEGVEEIDDLAEGGAEVARGAAFGFSGGAAEAAAEQVLEVPSHAVDTEQAEVVHMEVAVGVCVAHLGAVDFVEPVCLADFAGDVVIEALERVGHVAVFLDFPVEALEVLVDEFDIGLLDHFADARVLVAVEHIGLCRALIGREEERFLDDVLDLLDGGNLSVVHGLEDGEHAHGELSRRLFAELIGGLPRLEQGGGYLGGVEADVSPVALADFPKWKRQDVFLSLAVVMRQMFQSNTSRKSETNP